MVVVVETNNNNNKKKQNNGKGKRKEKQEAREDLRVCVPLEEEHVKRETITSVHVAP